MLYVVEVVVLRRTAERGAAAVEFALVLPVLLVLVLGIAEFGRVFNVQTMLSQAAREGARSMALSNSTTSARSAVKNAAPTLNLTDSQIMVAPAACPTSSTTAVTNASVTVTYHVGFLTTLFGSGLNVTGKGVMRCNG